MDTATVYNNLGCCFLKMRRFLEANAYFKLAQAIFELELGPYHYRTRTAGENLEKSKQFDFLKEPEYKPLWQILAKDKLPKGAKKKKKKKKGKK